MSYRSEPERSREAHEKPVAVSGLSQRAGRYLGGGRGRGADVDWAVPTPLGLPPKQIQMTKEKTFEQISRKARACSHTPDPCCRRVGG